MPDEKNLKGCIVISGITTSLMKDGKTISSYTIVPEYRSKPGDTTIGVFCHEFGHMIGGIDLYDLDGLVTQSSTEKIIRLRKMERHGIWYLRNFG